MAALRRRLQEPDLGVEAVDRVYDKIVLPLFQHPGSGVPAQKERLGRDAGRRIDVEEPLTEGGRLLHA